MYGWVCRGKNHFGHLSKCRIVGTSIPDPPAVLTFQSDFLDGNITPETGTGGTFSRTNPKSYFQDNSSVSISTALTTAPCIEGFVYNKAFSQGGIHISSKLSNFCLQTSAPATAPWGSVGTPSILDNNALGPDNTATSAAYIRASAPDTGVRQGIAAYADVQERGFCFSVFLRGISSDASVTLKIYNDADTESASETFILTNSWNRYSVGYRFSGAVSDGLRVQVVLNNGAFDNPCEIYFYGAQVEEASDTYGNLTKKPANWIRTTTVPANVNADVLTYPSVNLSSLTSGTVNLWVAPMYGSSDWLTTNLEKYAFSVNDKDIAITLSNDGSDSYIRGYFSGEVVETATTWNDNEWMMLTLVWNILAPKINLYINGSLAAVSNATLLDISAATINIGRSSLTDDYTYINGVVSLVKYYTGVATPSQIAALYTSEVGNFT